MTKTTDGPNERPPVAGAAHHHPHSSVHRTASLYCAPTNAATGSAVVHVAARTSSHSSGYRGCRSLPLFRRRAGCPQPVRRLPPPPRPLEPPPRGRPPDHLHALLLRQVIHPPVATIRAAPRGRRRTAHRSRPPRADALPLRKRAHKRRVARHGVGRPHNGAGGTAGAPVTRLAVATDDGGGNGSRSGVGRWRRAVPASTHRADRRQGAGEPTHTGTTGGAVMRRAANVRGKRGGRDGGNVGQRPPAPQT